MVMAKASSIGNVGRASTRDKEEGPQIAKECVLLKEALGLIMTMPSEETVLPE
jgi:hypothetical protein